MKNVIYSISLAALIAASGAVAQDIDTIAILTPEAGTDFGWNQQGVAAAKAAAAATARPRRRRPRWRRSRTDAGIGR